MIRPLRSHEATCSLCNQQGLWDRPVLGRNPGSALTNPVQRQPRGRGDVALASQWILLATGSQLLLPPKNCLPFAAWEPPLHPLGLPTINERHRHTGFQCTNPCAIHSPEPLVEEADNYSPAQTTPCLVSSSSLPYLPCFLLWVWPSSSVALLPWH